MSCTEVLPKSTLDASGERFSTDSVLCLKPEGVMTSRFFDKIDNGKELFKLVFEACSSDSHVVCKTAEEVKVWLNSVYIKH